MEDLSIQEVIHDIQKYLEQIRRDFLVLPMYIPSSSTMEKLYQPIHCVLYKKDFHSTRSQQHAFLFSSLPDVMEHDTMLFTNIFSLSFWNDGIDYAYEQAMQFYEYYVSSPVRWEQLREERQRLFIVGKQGIGKSSLLKHEAYRVATEQLLRLSKEVSSDQLVLPLYLPLEKLAQLLPRQTTAYDAIISLVQTEYALSDVFVRWLRNWLPTNKVLYLFDGLDTIAEDARPALKQACEQLDANHLCHIIITSRYDAYEGAPFSPRKQEQTQEIELLGFAHEQRHDYIRAWFPQQPETAQRLQQEIENNPVLRMMAQVPLLLSFLCSVFLREGRLTSTYGALYEKVIQALLEAVVQQPSMSSSANNKAKELFMLLEQMAWRSTHGSDQWSQTISMEALADVDHADLLLLERAGLLLDVSLEGNTGAENSSVYRFSSPCLQCYLVARLLVRQTRQQWEALLYSISRYNPYWQSVLVLLTGMLENPQEMIEVIQQLPTNTGTVFLLARAALEAIQPLEHLEKRKNIARAIFPIAYSLSRKEKRQAVALLIQVLGIEVREKLLNLLHNQQSSEAVRSAAILALGQLGDPSTFELLLSLLQNREERTMNGNMMTLPFLRIAVIWVLGQLEIPEATQALIAIISDMAEPTQLRWAAIWMLGQLRATPAAEVIRRLLRQLPQQTNNPEIAYLRDVAIWSLGHLKDGSAVEELLSLILNKKEDQEVITAARRALQQIGESAIPYLAQQIVNPALSVDIRITLIEILCTINSRQVDYVLHDIMEKEENVTIWTIAMQAWKGRNQPYDLEPEHARNSLQDPQEIKISIDLLLNRDASPRKRSRAMARLRKEKEHSIIALMIRLAQDTTEATELRKSALIHGWEYGGSEVWPVLIKILQNQGEPDELRACAVECLHVKGPQSVDIFLQLIRDRCDAVRRAAVKALGDRRDLKAVDALLEMIVPADPSRKSLLYEDAFGALTKMQDAQTQRRVRAAIQGFLAAKRGESSPEMERYLHWVTFYALSEITDLISAMDVAWRFEGQKLYDFAVDVLERRYSLAAISLLRNWREKQSYDEEVGGEILIVFGQLGYPDTMDDVFQELWSKKGRIAGARRTGAAFALTFMGFAMFMNITQSIINESK